MTLVNPLFTVTDAEPTNRYTSKGVASVHYIDRHDVVAERRRGHVDLVQKNAIAKHWNGKITPTWTLRANPRDRVPRASSDAVRTVLTAAKVRIDQVGVDSRRGSQEQTKSQAPSMNKSRYDHSTPPVMLPCFWHVRASVAR